jgi:Iap family predicted aminopeptidase
VIFTPSEKNEILSRVEINPGTDEQRAARLRVLFADAGCHGNLLSEQAVDSKSVPNIICRLPGDREGTIIIGAHYEHSSSVQRPLDNWSGAALLPGLYECLKGRQRHRTILFVAFADEGNNPMGAEYFAGHLSSEELNHVRAMINLDVLGLSPTKIWTAHSDKKLVNDLVHMVYVLKIPASQIDIESAGTTDSQPFAQRGIPQITIHSLTRQNLENRRASQFRPGNYYDTYRLLCGYIAYLDETLKARPHTG